MHFRADPMFPGDLHDAAARFAADAAAIDAGAAWLQARSMGWPALIVDEARGGAGGTLADFAAVLEASARQGGTLPLVRRCALAPALLMAAQTPAADAALRALCAGGIDLDVAGGAALEVAPAAGGGVRLAGTLELVDAALPFTHTLVATPQWLLLVPREALPAAWPCHLGLDGARTADLAVHGVELPAAAVLARGEAAVAVARTGADLGALATCIEIAATLGALLEHCIAHLSTRVQFGVALATFQVLRHAVVDLYVNYESASVLLARQVADTVAGGRLAGRDAALAKLYLNSLARHGAETAIQLHGGMGMTTELPATRLAQRLLAAEFEHGDRLALLEQLEQLPRGSADAEAPRGNGAISPAPAASVALPA